MISRHMNHPELSWSLKNQQFGLHSPLGSRTLQSYYNQKLPNVQCPYPGAVMTLKRITVVLLALPMLCKKSFATFILTKLDHYSY